MIASDPQAPKSDERNPVHQSDLEGLLIDKSKYRPADGGVFVSTVRGTAFHRRQAEACNEVVTPKPIAVYFGEELAKQPKVDWEGRTQAEMLREAEQWCAALDPVWSPRASTGFLAEMSFKFRLPENGCWYEGTIDVMHLEFDHARLRHVSLADYKTGAEQPDFRLSPQHHLYCLGLKYGVIDSVPYLPGHHILDWTQSSAASAFFPRKWPKEFRYLHLPALVNRNAAWKLLGMATDGQPMSLENSTRYICEITKRYLENQPTRLAVAIPAAPPQQPQVMGNPQTTAANPFKKATKAAAKLRLALIGPSGSGKTYTALKIATALGKRVAVMDTEHGSASKYAGEFDFDVLEPESFAPQQYINSIEAAAAAGYDVIVLDSLSHAWIGKDGALEQIDKAAAKRDGDNRFTAWRNVTPQHNALIDAIIRAGLHVVATMRVKTDYVMEDYVDARGNKKQKPVKVGLGAIQRDGLEYEFDVVADLDIDHNMTISKTRCPALDGMQIHKPGVEVANKLLTWLGASTAAPAPEQPAAPQYSWGEPRGEGYASDAQIKRLKANCAAMGVGEAKCLARIIQLAGEFGTTGIASVAEIPFPVATRIVIKVEEALKAKGIPRPEREKTEAERVEEQVRQIVGELRTKRAKELAELVRSGPLSANEIIDIMANEAAPDTQFSVLAEEQQEQVLHTIKRAAQAAADRVALAANGNGHH